MHLWDAKKAGRAGHLNCYLCFECKALTPLDPKLDEMKCSE
jgi:hypothetical protein